MGPLLGFLRSAVLVSLILSLSSASHVLGAGHLPAPEVVLLLGALLLMPLRLLTRRTLSFRSTLVAMAAGQMMLHGIFTMTAAPAVCRTSSALPGHHAAFELACSPMAPEQLAQQSGVAMLLFHGIATVVLALAVARSDAAVALLGAWLRPLVVLPGRVAVLAPEPRLLTAEQTVRVTPLSVHATVPTLRGPPRPVVTTR